MIWRILFALTSLTALGALLYLWQSDSAGDTAAAPTQPPEAGYVTIHGQLVQTGENGHALYRLDADRIEQPAAKGLIYVTSPRLDYQTDSGDHWTLTAQRGELPQEAQYADLEGNVHAAGYPSGSTQLMRIDTDVLHLDMPLQIATTASRITSQWAGRTLSGRGMRYEMKTDDLALQSDVHLVIGQMPRERVASDGGVTAANAPNDEYKALLRKCNEALCLEGPGGGDSTLTHLTLKPVTIVSTARAIVIKADRGEGDFTSTNSSNSHWVVTGNVQIYTPQGHLTSDRASVDIVNDRVTTLNAQGSPAQFERFPDAPLPSGLNPTAQAALEHARGHAQEIVFDVEKNELQLNGDTFLTTGCRELFTDHMTYDLTTQRLQFDPVKANIRRSIAGCGAGAEKP